MPIFRFGNQILLFVHIPKTGGTSVEKMLKEAGGIEAMRVGEQIPGLACTPQHFHADIIGRIIPEAFCDLAFTVVRNPYDRLASEFRMRVLATGRAMDFDVWVERVLTRHAKNPFTNDNHIRPQSEFLLDHVQIFRFEDDPLVRIAEQLTALGIQTKGEIPWERRSAPALTQMSSEMAARIRQFYAADFDRLGYRPDDYGPSLGLAAGI